MCWIINSIQTLHWYSGWKERLWKKLVIQNKFKQHLGTQEILRALFIQKTVNWRQEEVSSKERPVSSNKNSQLIVNGTIYSFIFERCVSLEWRTNIQPVNKIEVLIYTSTGNTSGIKYAIHTERKLEWVGSSKQENLESFSKRRLAVLLKKQVPKEKRACLSKDPKRNCETQQCTQNDLQKIFIWKLQLSILILSHSREIFDWSSAFLQMILQFEERKKESARKKRACWSRGPRKGLWSYFLKQVPRGPMASEATISGTTYSIQRDPTNKRKEYSRDHVEQIEFTIYYWQIIPF